MSTPALAVFAYAFPHRKTHDFLMELAIGGYRNLCVIAAPWRELRHADGNVYIPTKLRAVSPIKACEICAALGIPYFEIPHEDVDAIAELRETFDLKAGVISGARILKRDVIDLFDSGVVNFHPGSLPETAGLDLFYHTIRCGAPLGVTAHFIDHRVDAGRQIFFEETPIGPDDGPEEVQYNNYQTQIRALRRLMASQDWGAIETTAIERRAKNEPMRPDQKREVLARFPIWRNARHREQQIGGLLTACQDGDCKAVASILTANPSLLECPSPEGWTPLVVASFNQQAECVKLLLDLGADPNAAGKKGTTVLMYAKTAVINRPDTSLVILEMLLDAGADLARRDVYGQDILYYVRKSGDERLAAWLEGKGVLPDD